MRQIVTDRIVAMLEQGGHVFRERWTRAASRGKPRNGNTGAPYRGANVLLLWEASIEGGYASNVWLTYKPARALGGQVQKGDGGVPCAAGRSTAATMPDEVLSEGGMDEGTLTAEAEARGGVLLCRPF